MAENNFIVELIARINMSKSRKQIKSDIKEIEGIKIPLIGTLSKSKTRKQIKEDTKNIGDINTSLIGKLNKSKTKAQIKKDLESTNSTVNLTGKVDSKGVAKSVQQTTSQAQKEVDSKPLEMSFTVKKDKLLNDIKLLAQQNTKLFKNNDMAVKYNTLLDSAEMAKNTVELSTLRTQLGSLRSELKVTGNAGLTMTDALKNGLSKVLQLFGGHGIIMQFTAQLRTAWKEAQELDSAMTNLSRVNSEITRSGFPDYLDKVISKTKELSVATKDYIDAVTTFSRAGYNLADSEILADMTVQLEKVGDMSSEAASKSLLSGLQAYAEIDGYGMDQLAEKAQALNDKIDLIGNTASISQKEVAEGIQAVGSVMSDANTSVDEFLSLLAAGNRSVQDSNKVALAIRTSALRIRSCTAELEEMGEATDDVIESTADLAKQIKALTNIDGSGGVNILEADEETFRSIYDIYNDIAQVYSKMSDKDASSLLDLIAGKNRSNQVSAILQNMSEANELLEKSLSATGTASAEYEIYLDSAQAASEKFGVAMTETYNNILNGEMVKGLTNAATAVLDFANKFGLVETSLKGFLTLGILKGITTLTVAFKNSAIQVSNFGTALDAVKDISNLTKGTTEYTDVLNKLRNSCTNLTDAQLRQVLANRNLSKSQLIEILQLGTLEEEQKAARLSQLGLLQATNQQTVANGAATASTFSLSAAVKGLGVSLKTAFMNNIVSIAIMGVVMAIKGVSSAISEANKKLEENRQKSVELADAYHQQQSSLDTQIKKYKELKESLDSGNLSTDEARSAKEQLLEIQNSLIDSFGNEVSNLDLVNGKYKEQLGLLAELSKEKAADFIIENRDVYDDAKNQLGKERTYDLGTVTSWSKYSPKTEGQQALLDYIEAYSDFLELTYKGGADTFAASVSVKADVQNADEVMRQFAKDLERYGEENEIDVSNILDRIPEQLRNTWTDELKEYKQIYDEFIQAEIIKNDTLRPLYKQSIQAVEDYNNALSTGEGVAEAKANLDSIQQSVQNATNELEGSQDIFDGIYEGINKNAEAAYQLTQAFENDSTIQNFAEQLRGLSDIDIKAINLDNENLEKGEEAFRGLLETLGYTEPTEEQIQNLIDKLVELGYVVGETNVTPDITSTFDFSTYEKQIDDIQSSISTLRSALESFNKGELDKIQVIDLMQQFPELTPYIDLAADGFGNLSEGLSVLIAQQPDTLINSLQELKDALSTDEEREQVELLIDSLQRLSSYGDSGMEAYATTIGNTWGDTANVIEGVTTQFENLAKVQETVANGLTMSANAAAELAKMYPEILTNAEVTANGQITLNEEVVNSILDGDKSIIDAQIAKLEADKAVLEAKKETAVAELEIANQVGTAKGQITEEEAKYQIEALEAELKAEIEKNQQTVESYANATQDKAQSATDFNTYAATVANDIASNMAKAAASMAESMKVNSANAQQSMSGIMQKAADVAKAIADMATGTVSGAIDKIYDAVGGVNNGGINTTTSASGFKPTASSYFDGKVSLEEFKSGLELDIKGYTDAISNIDSQIEILKNLQATFDDNGGIGGHGYADKIKQLEKEKEGISNALKDSTSSAKSEFSETVDFFERRIDALKNVLSLLEAAMDNLSGSFAKNNLVDAELGITEEEINNYTDALAMYTQKANEALSKLPADIAAKVKDGAVALTDFVGDGTKDVVEAIKEYESWANKVADCKQELENLNKEMRQLEFQKFTNIMDDFNDQFNLRGNSKDLISKQIDLLKEAGELIGESYFKAQIDQSQKQLALLEAEKAQLVNQMSSAISSGRIQQGTDEWLSMVDALNSVDGSILDCKKSIEAFDNELLSLHTEIFNRIQEQFSNLNSEISNIIDLFDEFDVSDDKGIWSKEGIAQLGLLTQQYELAQYQVQQYNNEIDELNAQYLAGMYSATEYADKLAELNSEQWDAVKSAESAKDAIMDLNEARVNNAVKGIEKEIDAFKDLTDAQIKALKSSKDLHDYEKSIAEKTKSITDLERQIAAMALDDSAASVAKRKKLEEQLAEAKKDLEEAEYEHSVQVSEDALNQQLEAYEKERNDEIEALQNSLNDTETILAESFNTVKENADIIGQEIAQIAIEHGVTISDALISSWQSGEKAIASYGEVLSQNTSAFIGNIMGVENEVWNLQAQANITADSLAWMFSTRADNLVNELTQSYYAEANLTNMTNALQQSLINTLERGYNVSSIVNSLNSVTEAANAAANAVSKVGTGNNSVTVNTPTGGTTASNTQSSSQKTTSYNGGGSDSITHTVPWRKDIVNHAYANGTRNAKGGIIVKDEEGHEAQLTKLSSGKYALANDGDQIFTKEQTDNLQQWSKISLDDYVEMMRKNYGNGKEMVAPMAGTSLMESVNSANVMQDLWRNARISEPVVDNKISAPVTNHYDSLVKIEGDVIDGEQIVKQIEKATIKIADQRIEKHDNKMYDAIKYRRY